MASSGPDPASSTATCDYVFAFNENVSDCLLCPLGYYLSEARFELGTRAPYALQYHFRADSWEAAQNEAERLLREFKDLLLQDELEGGV